MFFDFRSLGQHSGVPPLFTTEEEHANGWVTSPYFEEGSAFNKVWHISNYNQYDPSNSKIIPLQYSRSNLYIEANSDANRNSDTYLTMRTARLPGFQAGAEIESREKYMYASMRMYARTTGSPGACTAMFTYYRPGELATVQEADIEVLTKDPKNLIHYTNQPSYTDAGGSVEGAAESVTLPKPWTQWGYHRLDWTPSQTVWSFDGKQTASNSFQVPRDPAQLMFNAWSTGDDGWTGLMPVNGKAYQQIQWIEILHGKASKATCNRICSVDRTSVIGKPVRV
jgi:hypothetical protein